MIKLRTKHCSTEVLVKIRYHRILIALIPETRSLAITALIRNSNRIGTINLR